VKELNYVVKNFTELIHKVLWFVFRDGDEDCLGYCIGEIIFVGDEPKQ
jgi:hypothetical protein